MAKKSKPQVLKKSKESSGIVKLLETVVVLGTLASVAIKFFRGRKK